MSRRLTWQEKRDQSPPEPTGMGSRVRDAEGDTWRRGRTRWSCEAPVDGVRVLRVGRLHWSALVSQYGPVEVVDP